MYIQHLHQRPREPALRCIGRAFHEDDEGRVVDGFLDFGAGFGGEETGACECEGRKGGEDW